MNLATFGAIMSFGLDLEQQAAAFYETAARGALKGPFIHLARGARKRAVRMERARREGVAEMILEPITGMDGDDYRVELSLNTDEAGLLKQAIALEEATYRFYLDAADKIPVREVARTCKRMAQESEQQKTELEELQSCHEDVQETKQ